MKYFFNAQRGRSADHGRQGIALVVVLGFVSLLMLMIVGFAISQRVERLVARAWLDGVKAEQLIDVAMARALTDIDDVMTSNGQSYPDFSVVPGGFSDALASDGAVSVAAEVFWNDTVKQQLPRSLWDDAEKAAALAKWTTVDAGSVTGRVAWLAVNCSGLVDANFAGGLDPTNSAALVSRAYGEGPEEIQLTALPEFTSVEQAKAFLTARKNTWKTFMSVPEINQTGVTNQNLFAWSWFPRYLDHEGNPVEKLLLDQTSVRDIGSRMSFKWIHEPGFKDVVLDQVERLFEDYRVQHGGSISDPESCAKMLVNSMRRYNYGYIRGIDSDMDTWGARHETIRVRRAPMLNEVVLKTRYEEPEYEGGTLKKKARVILDMNVEAAYLFPPRADEFDIRSDWNLPTKIWYDIRLEQTGAPSVVSNIKAFSIAEFSPADMTGSKYPILPGWIQLATWTYEEDQEPDPTAVPPRPFAGKVSINHLHLTFPAYYGDPRYPRNVITDLARTADPFPAHSVNVSREGVVSFQANDPRINWRKIDWEEKTGDTLGSENKTVTFHDLGDERWRMYQASMDWHLTGFPYGGGSYWRAIPLRDLAFFGHLLYDPEKPWQTIPLVGPDAMPVFEYFTVSTNRNDGTTGRVNLNSTLADVPESAVTGVRVENFPDSQPAAEYDEIQDAAKAEKFITLLRDTGKPTLFEALQSLTYQDIIDKLVDLPDKWAVDSLVARCYNLLEARQNLFTLVLVAQAGKQVGATWEVSGEKRALAVVWRDPVKTDDTGKPSAAGRHRHKTLFFTWLAD